MTSASYSGPSSAQIIPPTTRRHSVLIVLTVAASIVAVGTLHTRSAAPSGDRPPALAVTHAGPPSSEQYLTQRTPEAADPSARRPASCTVDDAPVLTRRTSP